MVIETQQYDGTSEAEWLNARGWQQVAPLYLGDLHRLILVSAHPDDETLGAAGLIARANSLGATVEAYIATDGEASHPNSPTLSPAQLAEARRAEVDDAIHLLAPKAAVRFFGHPDGSLRDNSDELRRHVRTALASGPSQGALIVTPWVDDRHRDHRALARVTRDVADELGIRMLEHPIWMWKWASPSDEIVPWQAMRAITLTPQERTLKAAAIHAHRTQISSLSEHEGDEVMLSSSFLAHFRREVEVFIEPESTSRAMHGLGAEFFDDFYEGKSDPWGFETRWYEKRKRAITMASLPRERFANCLEIGCSTGVLTEPLATRCDRLLALDISTAPLEAARERLKAAEHVAFLTMRTPVEWPEGSFDLIVLSEIAYYWSAEELTDALQRIRRSLTPDGILVACHWRYPVTGYPSDGDRVHGTLETASGLTRLVHHVEDDFVLDVFAQPSVRSVAAETGLLR